jgi:2-oxoisovalerate dehydrogenase E1 component
MKRESATQEAMLDEATISTSVLLKAWEKICEARAMSEIYEANHALTSKYVHATSKGHEVIQLAAAMQLLPQDYAYPYYRDDSMLLGIGMRPYDLMLQLFAKKDDPFSGGRTYYCHPSLRDEDKPKIPHQSSATGMQAIPATGAALGMWYHSRQGTGPRLDTPPLVLCSLGDASITEGEVAEAFQMAVLKKLPILYLIQDNEWDISAHASEFRAMDASAYAAGFVGLEVRTIDGTDFESSFNCLREVMNIIRKEQRPFLVHAKVPLLNHHTSGVRKEWYRHDLEEQSKRDPFPKFRDYLLTQGISEYQLEEIQERAKQTVSADFEAAKQAPDPEPKDLYTHVFAPAAVETERGIREPAGKKPTVMVDCALFAVRELMEKIRTVCFTVRMLGAGLGAYSEKRPLWQSNSEMTGYLILLFKKPLLLVPRPEWRR